VQNSPEKPHLAPQIRWNRKNDRAAARINTDHCEPHRPQSAGKNRTPIWNNPFTQNNIRLDSVIFTNTSPGRREPVRHIFPLSPQRRMGHELQKKLTTNRGEIFRSSWAQFQLAGQPKSQTAPRRYKTSGRRAKKTRWIAWASPRLGAVCSKLPSKNPLLPRQHGRAACRNINCRFP